MENLLDDKKHLDKFLEILPENEVYNFLNEELWNAEYRDIYRKMLVEYKKYRNTILSNFQNRKIKKANEDFDIIFKKLFSFLKLNFFRVNPNSNIIALYPQHKYSTDNTKGNFWDKKLEELRFLCGNFEKKYKNFITTAHEELSQKQENNVFNTSKNITEKIKRKSSNLIEEIICVEPNNKNSNTFDLVINNKHIISVNSEKKCWSLLIRVAKEKFIDYEKHHKSDLDNLNTTKRNRIYTRTGCKLTKILKVEGGQIVSNIRLEPISRAKFKRRFKKFNLKRA